MGIMKLLNVKGKFQIRIVRKEANSFKIPIWKTTDDSQKQYLLFLHSLN